MATTLDTIVDVTVTKSTTAVTTADFNTPLVLGKTSSDGAGTSSKTAIPLAQYTPSTLATAIGDGYDSNEVYLAVNAIFKQNPRCAKVYAGTIAGSSFATELAAVLDTVSDWYGLIPTAHLFATTGAPDALKTFCSENTRILGVQATSAPSTSSSAYTNPVGDSNRGFAIYHASAKAGETANAAWMGKMFGYQPGSANWNFKSLNEVTSDALTPQQALNLDGAKVSYHVTIAGVKCTQGGKMGSGEWIDIVVGTDWIVARLREEIYRALVNNPKLPMGDAGIQAVKGIIQGVLGKAADMGILMKDDIVVTVPKYADLSDDDKANRKVSGIKFSAKYEGAINSVGIDGSLSY